MDFLSLSSTSSIKFTFSKNLSLNHGDFESRLLRLSKYDLNIFFIRMLCQNSCIYCTFYSIKIWHSITLRMSKYI